MGKGSLQTEKSYPAAQQFLDSLSAQFKAFHSKKTGVIPSQKGISFEQNQYIDYLIKEISSVNSCKATQELRDFTRILIKTPGCFVPAYALLNVLKSFQENQ